MDRLEQIIKDLSGNRENQDRLNRRQFLQRAALLTGGSLLAVACGVDPTATPSPTATTAASVPANAAAPAALEPGMTVSPDDPRLQAGPIEFQASPLFIALFSLETGKLVRIEA